MGSGRLAIFPFLHHCLFPKLEMINFNQSRGILIVQTPLIFLFLFFGKLFVEGNIIYQHDLAKGINLNHH